MIDVFKIFAKSQPYVSLFKHSCDTGECSGKLWDLGIINRKIISREHLCLLVAMHDIGKCHPSFQQKGLGKIEYIDLLFEQGYVKSTSEIFRHELATEDILLKRKSNFANKNVAMAFRKILRLHHQKSNFFTTFTPSPQKEAWIAAQDMLIEKIETYFGVSIKEVIFEVSDSVCTMLWGIVILSDWITSGGLSKKADDMFGEQILPAKDFLEMFELTHMRPLQEKSQKLIAEYKKREPTAIIIEAPMGEGKTEVALYLAAQLLHIKNKRGIYVALPTMATAKQMESRVSNLLIKNGINPALLVHSESWLEQEVKDSENVDKSWFSPTKRSLLSNYAVGTVDQAMMAVLRIKHGILRLLGLSSKVLIIDEVHAYDSYMQTIIFRLLEWCSVLDIPVIILSATLPNERKNKILKAYGIYEQVNSSAYPLITSIYKDSYIKEERIQGSYMKNEILLEKTIFTNYQSVADIALESINCGGCACIIMNTVKDAQEVYKSISKKVDKGTKLLLFHSRFLNKDRKSIENCCLEIFSKNSKHRPQRAILVATQVVEQSLDVDFDYMISALAPIDLLLQRCGRLHRHNRIRPAKLQNPQLTVLINSEGIEDAGIGRVYDFWITKQTQNVICDRETIRIPDEIRNLIEQVYSKIPSSNDIENLDFRQWLEKQSKEEVLEGKAKNIVFPKPEDDWFFPLESEDFFEETSQELVCSDAFTRVGGNNIKLAMLPDKFIKKDKLENPSKEIAKQILENTVTIRLPLGCIGIELSSNLMECGGYLKGMYAMPYSSEFTLNFISSYNNIRKRYAICSEYGLKEEK